MEDKIIEKTEEKIKEIIDSDINMNNVDTLYKLTKIKHMTKEDMKMNYGNYGAYSGRGPSRGAYGAEYGAYSGYGAGYGANAYGANSYGGYSGYGAEYGEGSYGRRGVDSKYQGYGHLDAMAENYGRYSENRERYGNNEETKKSLKYMLKSMEDFVKMLKEEAQSPEEMSMIRESVQRIANM